MIFLSEKAVKLPKFFIWLPALLSMLIMALVAVPTFSTTAAKFLNPLTIDADPENMLFYEDPERIFHRQQKEKFNLYDLIVVGVVNTTHKNGVFNKASLQNIHDLTNFAKNIRWESEGTNGEENITEGVISVDLIAPSSVDNVEQGGPGTVKFDWLMSEAPASDSEALIIREKARNQPLLDGSLLSENGKAIALYVPITSKGISYQVTQMLRDRIKTYSGSEKYYITGLPVAQDTFAVEMFIQMGLTTPLAMGLIFGLLWYFFRNVILIISPMLVAMISVTLTMGLLVITGNNIHIMSSMIPIFVMPVAILDAIHILSEFYDRYPEFKDRKKTVKHVMAELSLPMLFTTLTTSVGFFSLNFTPLPPIQVFGTFVGVGVILAWFFTMTLIPAYIMLMPEHKFTNFGLKRSEETAHEYASLLARFLNFTGEWSHRHAKKILTMVLLVVGVALYGANQIIANDNPVKWFGKNHEIRVADKKLNEMFGGTYMSYLSLKAGETVLTYEEYVTYLKNQLADHDLRPLNELEASVLTLSRGISSKSELMSRLTEKIEQKMEVAPLEEMTLWDNVLSALEALGPDEETFKDPEVLNYISGLQSYLLDTGYVGKSNSVVEIVKTVHRELYSGHESEYRIPEKATAVAQTLITFQNSHRPQDLWHYVTPDFREANVWMQLKSGDNQDTSRLEAMVDDYFTSNPPPKSLQHKWFGLNHINVTWQDQIVLGMAKALGGSFIVVLMMMIFLFRSILWGVLAMIPLSFSIAVLYGIVGLIGKDYDAPIAILSALILGLTVDYAIHFLSRSRQLYKKFHNWPETIVAVYGEPARAISRNVIIMGVGFLPLLLAPLTPYQDVGLFISSILIFAGIATLVILPAIIRLMEKRLFNVQVERV